MRVIQSLFYFLLYLRSDIEAMCVMVCLPAEENQARERDRQREREGKREREKERDKKEREK